MLNSLLQAAEAGSGVLSLTDNLRTTGNVLRILMSSDEKARYESSCLVAPGVLWELFRMWKKSPSSDEPD